MTTQDKMKRVFDHLIENSIHAVAPSPAIRSALQLDGEKLTVAGQQYDLSNYKRVIALGAGKASAAMAETLESLLGNRLHSGIIATKYGHTLPLRTIKIMEAGHPVPDMKGELAARALLSLAHETTEKDLVFCLISGGASAIVPAPRNPVTLAMKQQMTKRLLECGATINEINLLRKHLSLFKGGHLAKALEPATVITLIISDVVGDHLDVIGSGPTAPDTSTYKDCQAILDKYSLHDDIPDAIIRTITDGCAGHIPETRKQSDQCFQRVQNVIIAGNAQALAGATEAARKFGYEPIVINNAMEGEARDIAKDLVHLAIRYHDGEFAQKPPICLLCGGETTVTIRGNGTGGRNQEFALAATLALSEKTPHQKDIAIMSFGTDGSDGPTDAAGALVLPDHSILSDEEKTVVRQHLKDNNAYAYFDTIGALIKTGPTQTNVMDIAAVLINPK